ncbi:diacylglycerol kinase family protein [Candidatus Collierbacteria bacterium]|nr:diacylglycerol kinase family protein [Candidatus Collierbacteria bacterium]
MSVRRHTISFKHAFDGVLYTFRTQPNFRIHTLAAILVIFLGFTYSISSTQWLFLALTISLVFVTEMLNTSLESVTDLVTDKYHLSAKIAKDVSAGMVLLTAVASVVIGLIIFIPYLIR